jgi:hypothetical protein
LTFLYIYDNKKCRETPTFLTTHHFSLP